MNHEDHEHGSEAGTRGRIVLLVFLAIAAFFLISEHLAHAFGVLPYLLVLACPLMHLLHHGGHGAHRRRRPPQEQPGETPRPGAANEGRS